METSQEKSIGLETQSAIRGGEMIFNISKVWGGLEIRHRGDVVTGGMTWVPDGQLPLRIPCKPEITIEDAKSIFSDLLSTLMPSVKVFVKYVDGKTDEDF